MFIVYIVPSRRFREDPPGVLHKLLVRLPVPEIYPANIIIDKPEQVPRRWPKERIMIQAPENQGPESPITGVKLGRSKNRAVAEPVGCDPLRVREGVRQGDGRVRRVAPRDEAQHDQADLVEVGKPPVVPRRPLVSELLHPPGRLVVPLVRELLRREEAGLSGRPLRPELPLVGLELPGGEHAQAGVSYLHYGDGSVVAAWEAEVSDESCSTLSFSKSLSITGGIWLLVTILWVNVEMHQRWGVHIRPDSLVLRHDLFAPGVPTRGTISKGEGHSKACLEQTVEHEP